jgi:uncharacterized protein DUF3606
MSDDKNLRGQQDRSRVSASEPYEVENLHQKYPHLSHQQVKDAIVNHGPDRKKIEAYLDTLRKK